MKWFSVHAFTKSSFDTIEGGRANISFQLNAKGATQFPTLVLSGTITSVADGTAGEKEAYLCKHQIAYYY